MAHYKAELENGVMKAKPVNVSTQNVVPLTWAQYQALSNEAKMNGTIYHITDRHSTVPNSSMVAHGNGTVNSKLDELDGKINELESLDIYKVGTTAPSNTKTLWIDTGNQGIMKYYDGSGWVSIASAWS